MFFLLSKNIDFKIFVFEIHLACSVVNQAFLHDSAIFDNHIISIIGFRVFINSFSPRKLISINEYYFEENLYLFLGNKP